MEKMEGLVSITAIIPNYNHGIYLAQRLDSVYGQTYPNLQVILLDDASTDNSLALLETYRHHPRTQALVVSEKNSGSPFPQWRKGMEMAKTDWVWIAESDDYCAPDFLEALLPGLENPDCVMAFNELHWVNDDGEIIRAAKPVPPFLEDGKVFFRKNMRIQNHMQNVGMAVERREVALKMDSGWTRYRKSGDYRFFAELVQQGMVYGSGQPLAFFRRHPQQITTRLEQYDLAYTEKLETYRHLLQKGYLQPADLYEVLRTRLLENEIAKVAKGKQEFKRVRQYWMNFAHEIGLGITNFEIKRLAFWAKVKHRMRK
jgi:glycosyltransferase involved in cell wall biosynthesis